jgi:hypothetical protein
MGMSTKAGLTHTTEDLIALLTAVYVTVPKILIVSSAKRHSHDREVDLLWILNGIAIP